MKEETVEDLKKRLTKQQAAHASDIKKLRAMERVFEVMIAAGVLDRDKYQKAQDLVSGYMPADGA